MKFKMKSKRNIVDSERGYISVKKGDIVNLEKRAVIQSLLKADVIEPYVEPKTIMIDFEETI